MRTLLILITICFSATALAQAPPPKTARSKVQPKPQAPMGCKLVGTVKGTKIWAGDCGEATGIRGTVPGVGAAPAAGGAPLSPPEPAASPIPPDQKQ